MKRRSSSCCFFEDCAGADEGADEVDEVEGVDVEPFDEVGLPVDDGCWVFIRRFSW